MVKLKANFIWLPIVLYPHHSRFSPKYPQASLSKPGPKGAALGKRLFSPAAALAGLKVAAADGSKSLLLRLSG